MKTKKVVRKIFDTLNYSKKLKISSILLQIAAYYGRFCGAKRP